MKRIHCKKCRDEGIIIMMPLGFGPNSMTTDQIARHARRKVCDCPAGDRYKAESSDNVISAEKNIFRET